MQRTRLFSVELILTSLVWHEGTLLSFYLLYCLKPVLMDWNDIGFSLCFTSNSLASGLCYNCSCTLWSWVWKNGWLTGRWRVIIKCEETTMNGGIFLKAHGGSRGKMLLNSLGVLGNSFWHNLLYSEEDVAAFQSLLGWMDGKLSFETTEWKNIFSGSRCFVYSWLQFILWQLLSNFGIAEHHQHRNVPASTGQE